MDHTNWWLVALAFVLGLVLTFAQTIRRVKREVPVGGSTDAAPAAGAVSEAPTTKIPTGGEAATSRIPTGGDAPTTKIPTAPKKAATSTAKKPSEADTTKIPVADADQVNDKPREDDGK